MLNGFKQNYYSQNDADNEETSTKGTCQELLSKLESPGETYLTHKTFTVTPTGIFLRKGEEIGMFEMGSTIVMLFECPINSQVLVKEGDKVKMGQKIT
jgi:phosphatidylserine decarboxylase